MSKSEVDGDPPPSHHNPGQSVPPLLDPNVIALMPPELDRPMASSNLDLASMLQRVQMADDGEQAEDEQQNFAPKGSLV